MLILASEIAGFVSIYGFASLICVPIGITRSFAVGIKFLQSLIKKKKKKHDQIVLFGKDKLNTIEALISKFLIDSYISHDKFVSVNNVLREN